MSPCVWERLDWILFGRMLHSRVRLFALELLCAVWFRFISVRHCSNVYKCRLVSLCNRWKWFSLAVLKQSRRKARHVSLKWLMRGRMNDGWRQIMFPVHPSANRQQLLEETHRCRVREVRSDKSVAIITRQPWVLNGGFLCHVQLPAGDKHCLAEPVNLPATLGTCPYRFNWCMHPQRWRLILLQQKYGSLAK